MAENVANSVTQYWLHLQKEHQDYLMEIRHWENLKMAADESNLWVKGFTQHQLSDTLMRSIPFARMYVVKDNLLFAENSSVPERKMPSLLWTPLLKAMPVSSPDFNHNYFGIEQIVPVRLIASDKDEPAIAFIVALETLSSYINKAAAIRLLGLQWCVLSRKDAMIYGTPLLPLNGKSYWSNKGFLLPGGYDFELPVIAATLYNKLNAQQQNLILFHDDATYTLIPKNILKPLSIASFRKTTGI